MSWVTKPSLVFFKTFLKRMHLEQEEAQYLPMKHILEPQYQHHDGLTRSQAEIVAGRISALNECFY